MAKETEGEEVAAVAPTKSKVPLIAAGLIVVVLLGAVGVIWKMKSAPPAVEKKELAELAIPAKVYQLSDGGYLNLSFSVEIDAEMVPAATELLTVKYPAKVEDAIIMSLGNKGREELINGQHKREAFKRELKRMLESEVFDEYNKQHDAAKEIKVYNVRLSNFTTQSG